MKNPNLFVLIVLVLGMFLSNLAKADPDLLAWYKFDDGAGTTAIDSSSKGNHGVIIGATWAVGQLDGALNFDGDDDYVDCNNPSALNFGTGNWSVCVWFNTTVTGKPRSSLISNGGDGGGGIRYTLCVGESKDNMVTLTTDDNSSKKQVHSSTSVTDGVWHHVVGVREGDYIKIYLDGNLEETRDLPWGYDLSGTSQHNALIGAITNHSTTALEKYYTGLIDDVRIYSRALKVVEIQDVMLGKEKARNPNPADGATHYATSTVLSWTPGAGAVSHNVYFGTDQAAVNDANESSPEFQANLPLGTESYTVTDLVPFTTYYWRIDEVNGFKGSIWFFINGIDCNGNGVPDHVDIADGNSLDCNGNGVPDECDIADGTSKDIDGNGVPDECEPDCNRNGVPDHFDIAMGTSQDINGNDIPDKCELDCNGNGINDFDDIANRTSVDCDENEVPDECQEGDINGDGIDDKCEVGRGPIIQWGLDYWKLVSGTPVGNDFIAVAAATYHSVALKSDGSLAAWGYDNYGQVSNTPVGNKFIAVAAGEIHNVALKADGSLVAWGYDYYGQVSSTPDGNDFIAVAAGKRHNVALKSDGSLVAWGQDYDGQVSNTPDGNDFIAVSVGYYHGIALQINGSLIAWGNDRYGQVSSTPDGNDFIAVSAGSGHNLALKSDGSLVAWGYDKYGQVSSTPDGNDFIAVATGNDHSVALKSNGSLVAWGYVTKVAPAGYVFVKIAAGTSDHSVGITACGALVVEGDSNSFGQLNVPEGNDFLSVAAGRDFSVALKADGSLVAWGRDDYGECNAPSGNDFKEVACGYIHSLAIRSDGSLVAWGFDNDDRVINTPDGNDFIAVAAGFYHSVALKSDGSLVAWGVDISGSVSDTPDGNDFIAVAAGFYHSIALKSDGSLIAWGADDYGQASGTPAGNDFVAVAAGERHSVALKTDGSLVAWGDNEYGQCDVPSSGFFSVIACGELYSLAIPNKNGPDMNRDSIADQCQIDIRIEPVITLIDPSSTSEVLTELPQSVEMPEPNDIFYIELWASDTGDENTGLTSVYVDVSFCGEMSAISLEHGTIFTTFPTGIIQSGGVDEFGGSGLPSGIEPEWVRVGWIEMACDAAVSECTISLLESTTDIAALERGLIPWWAIHLGSITLHRDCNGNGIPDVNDIANRTSKDCNGNGIPDECDIASGTSLDCNGNGIPDECDIANGTSLDCNGNGIPDECDIATGTSQDINGNGIPDECDPDCNGNGIPDDIDIATGTSLDCNGNAIPDECDIANGTSLDCNGNGIPDECDIATGTSQDINGNGVPDECDLDCNGNGVPDDVDIATGTSKDLNGNGIPDECEDCNGNGILDDVDIILGISLDCNGNGIPDECDIASGTSLDNNGNGVPDECDAPFSWTNVDIGSAQELPGSASYNHVSGVWTVTGSGHDIDGSEDGFHYMFRPLSSDGMMEINLVSMDVTDDWARAGVMIRETLDPSSRHAFMAMTWSNSLYQFVWRQETGGDSDNSVATYYEELPKRMRITRQGDELIGEYWTWIPPIIEFWGVLGNVTIPMNTDVYIGLAVCSHNNSQLCTAVFDNVIWPAYNRAWLPIPDDGSKRLPVSAVTLSWMKGDDAADVNGHEVYLGTDPCALPLVSIQTATAYNAGPLDYGTKYYWRINEVGQGGTTTGNVWSFKTELYGTGSILREIWEGIPGDLVGDLTAHPNYPDNPTWSDELTLMESPAFVPDKEYYGGRLIGYLHPETSGDYTFWIASDDSSELWLSATESAGDAVNIAHITGWCGVPRDWDNQTGTDNPYQQSTPVSLEADRIYYISAIWKEHGGGDHCAVAWQGPDSPVRSVIDGYYLSPDYVAYWAYDPSPHNGAVDVPVDANLSWISGDFAAWHEVYLGTDPNAMELVATKPLGDENYNPGQLALDTAYYWQVVEVNDTHPDSPWPGSIWSFRTLLDCNRNLIPDHVDIADGNSLDCNGNGIPDECDIADGNSLDCNGNGIPDECDIANGTSFDCNGNGIPDECDIADGNSLDCNGNGIPDECDIADGNSTDVNGDGIPDECQIDIRIVPIAGLIDPASTSEVRTTLPESMPAVVRGSTYYLEIWASDLGATNTGLSAVYVDLSFCGQTSASTVEHGTIFVTFTDGTIQPGGVDEFGGMAIPSGGGIEPNWVRIGWIRMSTSIDIETCTISLLPSSRGVAALERGWIPWIFVDINSVELQITPPARSYDLDGDTFIGVGDLSWFRGSWLETVPPANKEHDFDCDSFVGVSDLSWFATGWQKSTNDPTILYPSCTGGAEAMLILNNTVLGMRRSDTFQTSFSTTTAESSADVAFELVVLDAPSASDTNIVVPTSIDAISNGQTYYLEVWATDRGYINTGLTSAYVDLSFPDDAASVVDIFHSGIYPMFNSGSVISGKVDELGGSTLDEGIGVESQWARVAIVQMHADAAPPFVVFALSPSSTGVGAYGRGSINWNDISLSSVTIGLPADLNNDGRVDLFDVAILTKQWRGAPGEPSADIAPGPGDGVVDWLDLAVLAEHWLEGIAPGF